ncbi:hypothetical protein S4A8_03113 [Salinisphaera sp. S4-8]|uniref:hypothetical protein n=1 Tax=Salinisphaera sp. S4-8 TaxID=633357 RepID=UPI003340986D
MSTKIVIAAVVCVLSSGVAFSQSQQVLADQAERQLCDAAYDSAERAMASRQSGVDLPTALRRDEEAINQRTDLDPELKRLMTNFTKFVVSEAYTKPVVSDRNAKIRAIDIYRNTSFNACIQG